MGVFTKIFGDANARYLTQLQGLAADINAHETGLQQLSDEALRAKSIQFQKQVTQGLAERESQVNDLKQTIAQTSNEEERQGLRKNLRSLYNEPLDEILAEAFGVVREAARRTLNQRHFDVQLIGGLVLHRGQVAEMKTGEGKTLTSTLAIYLNALLGRGVHVVTVNDYLARRDVIWMGQIFHLLGLSVAAIVHDASYQYDPTHTVAADDAKRDQGVVLEMEFMRPITRKEAYRASITYGTNNEFGFDYLRDNMVMKLDDKVQRPLYYAIIDEADSILIDEARTPLIISAPDARPTDRYYQFAKLVSTLEAPQDYTVDEKQRAVSLTEQGIAKAEKSLGIENLYLEEGIQTLHHIEQALKAKALFTIDKDYTIKDGAVIIVDEFTGRMLPGRRYSEGLHQAIEAKEGLTIEKESRTMATVTIQNYFRLYEKLAGMTGTAETEAEELSKIYSLEVTTVPTNKPMIRRDIGDRIYKNTESKFKAVIAEVRERHEKGQPVLIGTISIEKNEYLASLLEREGLPFNVLNAKQHEREAEIIAQAGAVGAITLATNIAGRGVDIILGGKPFNETEYQRIVALGGLHILGTERHESRRIDNQLRGRAGRQGDTGSSQFYISLEDDLMRIFGAERIKFLMKSWPDDAPIENAMVSKSIESAQKKVEGHNFDIRKHLVEYDDVANKQRMFIYAKRNTILTLAQTAPDDLRNMVTSDVKDELLNRLSSESHPQGSTSPHNHQKSDVAHMLGLTAEEWGTLEKLLPATGDIVNPEVTTWLEEKIHAKIASIEKSVTESTQGTAPLPEIMKFLLLRSIDIQWIEHLETLNYLRTGIGLRGYGQRDPVVEYKREARDLFKQLNLAIRSRFVMSLLGLATHTVRGPIQAKAPTSMVEQKQEVASFQNPGGKNRNAPPVTPKPRDEEGKKLGRNDPCFCGSGKKYKRCHGAQ